MGLPDRGTRTTQPASLYEDARSRQVDDLRKRVEQDEWRVGRLEVAQPIDSYHLAVNVGNALRMAVGEAILITTADEVRMPREDWNKIVEAAIAQRRAVDPLAVPDE
jgi:hypothetical protein